MKQPSCYKELIHSYWAFCCVTLNEPNELMNNSRFVGYLGRQDAHATLL